MNWLRYGADAVRKYDLDLETDADKVFYRCAYFDFMAFEGKKKAVVSGEVDMGSQRYFCLITQIGGDSLLRISANIWNVGIEFSIWGYA